ncbi:MAG: hypothetical protein KC431_19060, partial [Myxococcales bacterium]|nr:hypothetical protein [Myxococcales bacterium]
MAQVKQWAAIALTLVLAALAGMRAFVTGRLSPFFSDIRFTHHPLIRAGGRVDGHWPLWSDAIFNGHPLIADAQAAQFYPPVWVVRWWDDPDAFTAFIIFHLLVAGLGMAAWLRSHDMGLPAQLLGALSFAFSGPLLSLAEHLGLFAVLAWIPAWLAALHRLLRAPGPGAVAIAAVVLAMPILAGGPQMLAAAVWLTAIYGLGLWLGARRESAWQGRALLVRGATVLAVLALAAALTAITLLPQLEFLPLSQRSIGLELAVASKPNLAPHALWRLLLGPTLPRPASGKEGDQLELYVGTITVVLAMIGLITTLRPRAGTRREPGATALVAAMTVAFVVVALASLGPALPVFSWIVKYVPGMAYFRAPSRLIGIAVIPLVYVAALGLERWLRGEVAPRLVMLVTAALVLVAGLALLLRTRYGG